MVNSVAGEIQRIEGVLRGLAILIDKENLSGFGLPMHWPGLPAEVLSRINPGVIDDMCKYFIETAKSILTSTECLVLDGACRSCLSLLPRLAASVAVVVERVKGGGKLWGDLGGGGAGGEGGGEIIASIVELLDCVKLVAANDLHGLQSVMQHNFHDLDDNDMI